MKDFLILGGGGMQGKIVARDLLENGRTVFLADLYPEGAKRIIVQLNSIYAIHEYFVELVTSDGRNSEITTS